MGIRILARNGTGQMFRTTDVRTMKGGVEVYGSGQAARNNPALKR